MEKISKKQPIVLRKEEEDFSKIVTKRTDIKSPPEGKDRLELI
jgi:hypothetical protein